MSVAFRRDTDDEHLEPRFELPIPPGPNLVTQRGLELIAARLSAIEALLTELSDEEAIKAARRDLRYWSTRQATAQLVETPAGDRVAFGCRVTIEMHGKQREVTIVGDDEASPADGLVSFSAPLSRALMVAEVGDLIDFGGRAEAIEIIGIAV